MIIKKQTICVFSFSTNAKANICMCAIQGLLLLHISMDIMESNVLVGHRFFV